MHEIWRFIKFQVDVKCQAGFCGRVVDWMSNHALNFLSNPDGEDCRIQFYLRTKWSWQGVAANTALALLNRRNRLGWQGP